MSYTFPNDFDKNGQNEFDDGVSTFKWVVAASVFLGVISTIATVAIVYAIIDCLKKAGSAIPSYARIANTTDADHKVSYHQPQPSESTHMAITIPPVIQSSQVEFPTVERFLKDMAREKPIRFSHEQLMGFSDNYSTILGSGAFGVVFKGEFPNGIKVAIKVLTNTPDKRIEEQFMAEVSTIGRTYHINLVRLFGFCFDPTARALVYEYMENGSLDKLLFDENREIIEWEKLHQIAIGTAKGIAYLHEECQQRIIHYDIKPGNILLDGNMNPKVADFGLAKLCNRERTDQGVQMTGCRGTPGYAAPELWKPYPVTHKCDVYSFGILLFEILGRRRHHDVNNVLSESQQWLPRWTWDKLESDELEVMLSIWGIEEKDREKAERMAIVALWCVQYLAEARPQMSSVVKMLEGDMEIALPPNPFEHLQSFRPNLEATNEDWSTSVSAEQSNSKPLHNTFEIELTS